ncbi:2-deoxy-scyllo-inosamine dehydrogenase [Symmachiella macrocystis]|uniref:2-deoxy-scyllo-inosamine dehydrogenase n=1 Tax=Symmachiella macrocystis TaxID=2527985 RepID=A0A5C6BQT6_9PLAN|nr:alcohol dehydrogenase catalytic domain-containing protein [Symmachiella macrocystis]TWU14418.1 2-deoxy-scyllo-inosamine dehydrogenase [Symmachiella macrocystis]
MRAIMFDETGISFRDDIPQPVCRENEVLIHVLLAGLCETDLQLVQGYMGFHGILGHEFVGIAETGRFAGQRVVGEINCACGNCETCRRGLVTHCPHRSVLGILNHDGAFADYIAVPEVNLHRVPDEISTEAAVFTEPLAAAFQIPAQIPFSKEMRVVVLGDGRLGNLCAQVIRLSGATVSVVGKHRRKLALLEEMGIATGLLENLSPEHSADVVVDCTGSPSGLPTAYQLVKPRGTIVLKTTVAGTPKMTLAPLVIDEITVVGSRCGPFDRAVAALENGEVEVLPLIDHRLPLSAALEAFEIARTTDTLKILLHVNDP